MLTVGVRATSPTNATRPGPIGRTSASGGAATSMRRWPAAKRSSGRSKARSTCSQPVVRGGIQPVRKVSYGVGVERTFPLHSPIVEQIEVVTRGDVRRAKLYYLRGLRGKAAKIRERRENSPAAAATAAPTTDAAPLDDPAPMDGPVSTDGAVSTDDAAPSDDAAPTTSEN